MSDVKTGPVLKGQIRCFHCRAVIKTKDGAWCKRDDQQVFLCKVCAHAPEQTSAPARGSK